MGLQKFEIKYDGRPSLMWNYYVHIRYPNLQLYVINHPLCTIDGLSCFMKMLLSTLTSRFNSISSFIRLALPDSSSACSLKSQIHNHGREYS